MFLALKQANLPEGETKPLKFQPLLEAFLQSITRPTNNSTEIYMPFKMSNKRKYWNISQCITTLQRNTIDTFSDVILHPKRTREWGWKTDYIQVLLQKHLATRPIPVVELASWLFRSRNWDELSQYGDIVEAFFAEF